MELVVNSYGAYVRCNNGNLVIEDKEGKGKRVPLDKVTYIHLGQQVGITTDALKLAIDNEIPVYVNDKYGEPIGALHSPTYTSISTIRKGQLLFTSSVSGLVWIRDIIYTKIGNQLSLIKSLDKQSPGNHSQCVKYYAILSKYQKKLRDMEITTIQDKAPLIRGIEGITSKLYFECINIFLPARLKFSTRSQHPAKDPINALLNYGYGVLYSKVETALTKSGIDPYIGLLHRDNYKSPAFSYDFIETYRKWVDDVVFHLSITEEFTDKCFSLLDDGSCRLEQEGRYMLMTALSEYLSQKMCKGKTVRSRYGVIQMDAYALAKKFKKEYEQHLK